MFTQYFDHLHDPRRNQGKLHRLDHILVITLSAIIAGADGWDDIATCARTKADWLTQRLQLKHGTPSADTLRRVIAVLDPDAFARGFLRWVEDVAQKTRGEVIAIDGKALRRSYDKDDPKAMLCMISAWASRQHLVLAQRQVEGKSNEITAIPALLDVLDLEGCIVTIDAMGTQTAIAEQIITQRADYVLALKRNHPALYEEVRAYFERVPRHRLAQVETTELGHGRKEVRRVWASSDVDWLAERSRWAGLRSLVEVEAERHEGEHLTSERRYYLSSLSADTREEAGVLLGAIRSHWGIENGVHWVLDVVFREDESRIRREHGGVNLSVLRHVALNLLRKNEARATPGSRRAMSLRMKRKRAGWDDKFLAEVVGF